MIVKTVVDGDEGTEIYNLRIMKKGIESEGVFFQLILTDISGQNSFNVMLSCKSSGRLAYSIQDHKVYKTVSLTTDNLGC